MKIKTFTFNPFGENTYVASDATGECVIVDPGCYSAQERRALAEYIAAEGLKPAMAVCTHGHIDHILGAQWVKDHYGIPLAVHSADRFLLESAPMQGSFYGFSVQDSPVAEVELGEDTPVRFGDTELKIIPTPGHSPGHVCLYDEEGKNLFTGDTLFKESIGRTDLPGGDYSWIMKSILEKILPLGGDVKIFPGHGPSSTIGHEALYNPFITEVIQGEVGYED